jgi:opacity protein-like surface antigen
MVPVTATVRFLPLGRAAPVEPYIGGGVGFINWRYSETGEFVDSSDGSIFRATYEADGTAVGPVIVGGVRFPAGDAFMVGAEYKWQKAEGDTNPAESQLLGNKIDLGGSSLNFTFHIRF